MVWVPEFLPSYEKEKLRKKLRSPEEYEKSREAVKDRGPEYIEKEMDYNERMAELAFLLESEPVVKDELKKSLQETIGESGAESVVESAQITEQQKASIEEGDFDVSVDSNPNTNMDQLMLSVSGNVSEKVPVNKTINDSYCC